MRTDTTVAAGGTDFFYVTDSTPLLLSAGFTIDLFFTVPIVGWTATQ